MLCNKCNQNEANVHVVTYINDQKKEFDLCNECIKSYTSIVNFEIGNDKFDVTDVLSGIIEQMYGKKEVGISRDVPKCSVCGTDYDEFKATGMLGCSNCYTIFEKSVIPIISNVQSGTEHMGKIPKKQNEDIIIKKKIRELKSNLQELIMDENYEKAAEIRDEIRSLEGR